MSATADPEQPRAASRRGGSRAKRWALGVGAVAASLAVAWGTGRHQGQQVADAAEARAARLELERTRATGEFNAQRDRAIRLEARRRLHRAVLAVEERNFGVAEGHLAKASALLGRARGDAALDRLATEMGGAKLAATDDVSATRRRLLDWANAFDAAMPLAE